TQQIVIAGDKPAVERAVALAAERGGRKSVLLPVSAPFHCSLMKPAAERLAAALSGVTVSDPRVPVVRNVDAGVTRTAGDGGPFGETPYGKPEARHGSAGARPRIGGLGAISGPPARMNGKVAVITGGTRGIGLAIAAWMLEHGANVVVSGRDADRLNVALKELTQDGGSAAGLVADVTRREDAERVVELARERFGRLDVLVNHAGVTRDALISRTKDDD